MVPIDIGLCEVMEYKHTSNGRPSSDGSERGMSIVIQISPSVSAHSPERNDLGPGLSSTSNNVDELEADQSGLTASTTERLKSMSLSLVDDSSVLDEDGRCKKKRKREATRNDGEPRPRLKCPYSLSQPGNHTRASCRGVGFADMGKMK
jgi:hypothetical protein